MAASFHNLISITKSLSSTNYASSCCRNNTLAASSSNSNLLLVLNRSSGSTSSVDHHHHHQQLLLLLQSKNNKKRNRKRRGELTVRAAATTIEDEDSDDDDVGLSSRVIRDSSNLVLPFGGQTSTTSSTRSSSEKYYGLSSSVASFTTQLQLGVDVIGISDERSIQPIIVPPPSSSSPNNNTSSSPNHNAPPPPPPTTTPPQQQQNEGGGGGGGGDNYKMIDRAINAAFVLAISSFAITKLLTIDSDYWHGWTLYEIVRYAPQHNWSAYEEALKTDPVLAKMMISGIVYSLGDWIAQCYEGKPLLEFDRSRMFRSGIVGFSLHGSLSHYYYHFCEALFPFQDWWVVPAKVAFDQTIWSAIWNSIYYVVVGFLRFESPVVIFSELKATFVPMLTAGWKLWPFAHLITYGVIPVEQRLLWVDCIELIWVTILSTYSNEKSEGRQSEAINEKQ